jgi:hypothetical protein
MSIQWEHLMTSQMQKTYTTKEISELMGFSQPTLRKIFEREPGVLILNRPEKMRKRRYRSFRVPYAVYERVRRRLSL